ncbi:hypothetical protein GCM10027589_31020 [Actinocorallia lasiicapitis]
MTRRDKPLDRGSTAVEYALLTALVALVVVGAVSALGSALADRVDNQTSEVSVEQADQ